MLRHLACEVKQLHISALGMWWYQCCTRAMGEKASLDPRRVWASSSSDPLVKSL